MNQIATVLSSNEKVLWEGRPVLRVFAAMHFIMSVLFTLFVAALIGFNFVINGEADEFTTMLGIIFALVAVGLIIYILLDYRARHYAITDKRLIFQNGIIGRDFQIIDFDQVTNAEVSVNLVDKILAGGQTGTITISSKGNVGESIYQYRFEHVRNPYEVFKFLKQVSHDVKTDIEYPNKLRPAENPGYKTDYQPPAQP